MPNLADYCTSQKFWQPCTVSLLAFSFAFALTDTFYPSYCNCLFIVNSVNYAHWLQTQNSAPENQIVCFSLDCLWTTSLASNLTYIYTITHNLNSLTNNTLDENPPLKLDLKWGQKGDLLYTVCTIAIFYEFVESKQPQGIAFFKLILWTASKTATVV